MKIEEQNRILKVVKDNYSQIAADFDNTRKKHFWPELETLLKDLKDGDSILDIGCGNGRLLDVIGNKKVTYLGVDNSPELISLAKNNYPLKDFAVGDILNLREITDKKFDLVISVAVLHHLPGAALRLKALEQMKNVANGKIIFSVWRMWGNPKFNRMLIKSIWLKISGRNKLDFGDLLFPWRNNRGDKISERYYHAFTKPELDSLMQQAGFSKFKIYSNKYNYWVIVSE